MNNLRVAVVGAAGYTGAEALDLLLGHPALSLHAALSTSQAGRAISDLHRRLAGRTQLRFDSFEDTTRLYECDAWLLCTGHGRAAAFLEACPPPPETLVVDLGRDFRLAGNHGFTYGLPEAFALAIAASTRVANPGCFATAIQLALLPLAEAGLLQQPISITALTGSTGAGQAPSPTTHFSWRSENLSVYKPFAHQHLDEIRRTLTRVQPNDSVELPPIHFIPVRGDFARGIFCVAQLPTELSQAEADELFSEKYGELNASRGAPGVQNTFYVRQNPDLQQVVRTNHALVHPIVKNGQLGIISVLDNLRKGASSQALENVMLMSQQAGH